MRSVLSSVTSRAPSPPPGRPRARALSGPDASDLLEMLRVGCLTVLVVAVPPRVARGLRVALGRVLPVLLAAERGHVEIGPGAAQRFVAAAVDEVGTEDPIVVVAVEGVGAVPLVHAEVGVEVVGQRVPGDVPA